MSDRIARQMAEIDDDVDQMTAAEAFNASEVDRLETLVAQLRADVHTALRLCCEHEDLPFGGDHASNARHQREVEELLARYPEDIGG